MNIRILIALSVLPGLGWAAEPSTPAAKPLSTTAPATQSASKASATKPDEDPAKQLRANVHAMRVAIEQDEAAAAINQRVSGSISVLPEDSGSIAVLSSRLNNSLSKLDNRCLGVSAHNNGGNLILICGDNNGTNGQTESTSTTHLVVIPPASGPTETSSASAPSTSAPSTNAPSRNAPIAGTPTASAASGAPGATVPSASAPTQGASP